MKVFTISASVPFVDALAKGLLSTTSRDELRYLSILLPTRRACRSLREAFLRCHDGPLLLPRLLPIGELDAEELILTTDTDIAPAISPLRRQTLLARALLQRGYTENPAHAAALAQDLGRFLDEMQSEGVPFDRLATLVPAEYATHWQETIAFLDILGKVWPVLLEAEGAIDAATRRNLVLRAQIAAWQKAPPSYPIIAAGVTGSLKIIRDLVGAVAKLPLGSLVLPGLDQDLDEAAWQEVDSAHPQHGLKLTLEDLGVARKDVVLWSAATDFQTPAGQARERFLSEVLRPAGATEHWRSLNKESIPADALRGFQRVDCRTKREEADAIAFCLRRVLEQPHKRAALVTPDRELARLVAAALKRWDISVDDSAGQPLSTTPPGIFLRLTAAMMISACAPIDLLACFKHPLALGGLPPGEFRRRTRLLELTLLHGRTPPPGFAGLQQALGIIGEQDLTREDRDLLRDWLADIALSAQAFAEALRSNASASEILNHHIAFTQSLTGEDLWRWEEGEALAVFLDELMIALDGFPSVSQDSYLILLEAFLAGSVVRPTRGQHARLSIWGPIEARLQQVDTIVLGGLNEGTWPEEAAIEPFLSRPMRHTLGLMDADTRIGIAAHDFWSLAAAPDVIVTRAEIGDGAPTVASRWLLRLGTVLAASGMKLAIDNNPKAVMAGLDTPQEIAPLRAPLPTPPIAARPRRLSVTDVEMWLRDPYALYAKHILMLRKLEPIGDEPDAADRGNFLHKILDRFVSAYPKSLPEDPFDTLIAMGKIEFETLALQPRTAAFWWPRFENIAHWFIATQQARLGAGYRTIATEKKGGISWAAPAGLFTLTAKADRFDSDAEGNGEIIDYKTGTIPGKKKVTTGLAPQLPLEAAIALAGGFPGLDITDIKKLSFWRITGRIPAGEEKDISVDVRVLADQMLAQLKQRVIDFDKESQPYPAVPDAKLALQYNDYHHLERVQEWSLSQESFDEDGPDE